MVFEVIAVFCYCLLCVVVNVWGLCYGNVCYSVCVQRSPTRPWRLEILVGYWKAFNKINNIMVVR